MISAPARLATVFALSALAAPAAASDPEAAGVAPHFRLDPGRLTIAKAEPDLIRFETHGEYQVRLRGQTPIELPAYRADASTDQLSQTTRLTHWLRVTPELQLGERLRFVGQADLARGFIGGQPTQYVTEARSPYEVRQPLQAEPRWLFAEYTHGVVDLAAGQQPSHWGLGMVENDGDHPVRWGDYEGGTRVERVQLRLHPATDDPSFEFRLAGDLVFADAAADLRDDQRALRAVVSIRTGKESSNSLGLLAIYRHQTQPLPVNERAERAVVRHWTLDLTGQFAEPIPGLPAWVFGGFEAALRVGDSTLAPTLLHRRENLAGVGAVAQVGTVLTGELAARRYGRLVLELEWGYTSGDADPYDDTDHRFALDPSHNVGLVLFDEVIAWKTARAATIGQDPLLGARPRPEAERLASNGAVVGATYLHPQLVYRPTPDVDLLAAAVVAQTTADFVNPVAVYTSGRYENYDGGSPRAHDLGAEVMVGAEWRVRVDTGVTFQIGGQAATLFPGTAFADASGNRMNTHHAGIARFGVQY